MKDSQIEVWVLSILEMVERRQKVEDARIELKANWPEPTKAARRIAGHANSSRGRWVLWVIGLDEEQGPKEVDQLDVASWYDEVKSCFDGIAPPMHHLMVPTHSGPLYALLFDTNRVPFVVKNPAYGKIAGGPVSMEVPWREGTAVRTAGRGDLLKLLVPIAQLPTIEVLDASVAVERCDPIEEMYAASQPSIVRSEHLSWTAKITLYVTPRDDNGVVFPIHRTAIYIKLPPGSEAFFLTDLHFQTPSKFVGTGFTSDSHTIRKTNSEAIVDGPGKLEIVGEFVEEPRIFSEEDLILSFKLTPAGEERALSFEALLRPVTLKKGSGLCWILSAEDKKFL